MEEIERVKAASMKKVKHDEVPMDPLLVDRLVNNILKRSETGTKYQSLA